MNIKVSYMLISTLWASKMPTRLYYHDCWVWSSILKVISLQYFYNISKKEVRKGVSLLHADEHQSFYKQVGIIVFDGSDQICPKYPKKKVANIFAKSVAANFVFYCDPKHLDILRGSSHVYCYLFPRTARLKIFCLKISIS